MRLPLVAAALFILAVGAPAAAAQTAATNVVFTPGPKSTITWDGADGQQWAVVLDGPRGGHPLPLTAKRSIKVAFDDLIDAADWGESVTVFVAPCTAPVSPDGRDNTAGTLPTGKQTAISCLPEGVGPWAQSAATPVLRPPSVAVWTGKSTDPRGTVRWKTTSPKETAPVTGGLAQWRLSGAKRWSKTTLRAGATSFRIPNVPENSCLDVRVMLASTVGQSVSSTRVCIW